MTHEEFVNWLNEEVAEGRMEPEQRADLLHQKAEFDDHREVIRREFRNQIVGFVAGHRFEAREIHDLLAQAKSKYPDRMLYFEPVELDPF